MDVISSGALLFLAAAAGALLLPLPGRAKRGLLLLFNAAFLYLFHPLAPLLFLAASCLAFAAARVAARGAPRALLWLAAAPLLAFLFLPKLPFLAAASAGASASNLAGSRLVLFIGASYYTLRALHFVLDARRQGTLHFGLLDFLAYNSFFPALIAGPIERADHFKETFDRLGRPDLADVGEGVKRIFFGLLKRVVLGSILLQWAAPILSFAPDAPGPPWWRAWSALYAVALFAYFDFAGYSDLAIGAARLLGIRLAENFDNPYLRGSIAEFWRGWHLSLSFWIRDYLFLPLSGRSASRLRPHLAALVSMTLCGLWHGPNAGWIAWGFLHGAGLSLHQAWTQWLRRRFRLKKRLAASRLYRVLCVLLTFHFVCLTWVLVAIDPSRLEPALAYFAALFGAG
ncbi:MAG: MBOAT family protein [Planctomycetes bacterium]|nr:MBOAT family protein [Planctomycetota bacterium]